MSSLKCVFCKKDGHIINECLIVFCRRCGKQGHTDRVCKAKEKCEKCGKFGHSLDAECTRCKKHGHIAAECTLPKCTYCGKIGHVKESCLDLLYCEECDRTGHTVDTCWVCTRCEKRGHLAEYCTLPECDKCGKVGHSGDICWYCTFCSVHGHRTEDCFAAKNYKTMILSQEKHAKKTKTVPFVSNNEVLIGSQKPIANRPRLDWGDMDDETSVSSPVVDTKLPPFVSVQQKKF